MALSAVTANTGISSICNTTSRTNSASSNTSVNRSGRDCAIISASSSSSHAAAQLNEAIAQREYELLKARGLADNEIAEFRGMVATVAETGDPRGYVAALDETQRELLRKANSYGSELTDDRLAQMSDEGVANLLVTQDYRTYIDYNNDGVVDKGAGKTFVFLPPNAPDAVKDAWDATLAEMPRGYNRLLASSLFMVLSAQANIKIDAAGNAIGFYEPGESGYKNIFPTSVSGWQQLFDSADAYLDWSDKYITEPQALQHRKLDRQMLALFRQHLSGE